VLIAASIFYMALENVLGAKLRRRWMVAFGFGLVHGFGFAYGLQQLLQFAGGHLVTSLLAFNAGVELGQLAVLVVAIPALDLAFRHVPERIATIVLSLLVGHTAWHWLWERWERLSKFPWPAADPEALAGVVRWLIVLVLVSGLAWLVFEAVRRRKPGASGAKD
jgi:HupE / UreJ protein